MPAKKMNYDDIAKVLGRALAEPGFRNSLLAAPEQTLKNAGFKPDPAAITFFKSLESKSFDSAADKLNLKPRDGFKGGVGEA